VVRKIERDESHLRGYLFKGKDVITETPNAMLKPK